MSPWWHVAPAARARSHVTKPRRTTFSLHTLTIAQKEPEKMVIIPRTITRHRFTLLFVGLVAVGHLNPSRLAADECSDCTTECSRQGGDASTCQRVCQRSCARVAAERARAAERRRSEQARACEDPLRVLECRGEEYWSLKVVGSSSARSVQRSLESQVRQLSCQGAFFQLVSSPTNARRFTDFAKIRLVINANGDAGAIEIAEDNLDNVRRSCLADGVRQWRLPAPEGGGIAIVTFVIGATRPVPE